MRPHHITKVCFRCRIEKPSSEFNKCTAAKDGLHSWCKTCAREKAKQWRENNRQRHRESSLRWQRENPTRANERNKRWQNSHKGQVRESNRRYWRANPERNRLLSLQYYARKYKATGTHNINDIKIQYDAQNGKCMYCGELVGNTYHVDHVVPLSRGGSDGPENIVIACPSCNTSKNNHLPFEWLYG